jgi:Flp pilus assembly protein TadG
MAPSSGARECGNAAGGARALWRPRPTVRPFVPMRACFGALMRDRRGAAAVLLAVALVPLIGAVGLAVDSSVGYLLKTRMSKALDSAGLAAGRIAVEDSAKAEAAAQSFFDANFGTSIRGVDVEDIEFELDETGQFVTLSAEATAPTYFMRIFGQDELTVSARTVIQRETTGMELALVVDNTGSMWNSDTKTNIAGTPFEAMRNAALDLVDIIYGDEDELDNVWVSLVPFVATVNIGTSRTGWLASGDRVLNNPASFRPDLTGGGWKGCVMARAYPNDTNDATPVAARFTSFFYPTSTSDNNWPTINDAHTGSNAARKGPNLGCGTPITPLTASKATVKAGINAMRPWRRGGTAGNLGLAWGWRTLSPNWRGLWGNADLPLDYGTDFMEKVVVVLSDGNNEFYDLTNSDDPGKPSDFTAYGRVNAPGPVGLNVATTGAGVSILNARMLQTCTAMKQPVDGKPRVRIYTIIFNSGNPPSTTTRELYQNCATTPAMYYYAPNNAELAKAFRAIGGQLANLMIVE